MSTSSNEVIGNKQSIAKQYFIFMVYGFIKKMTNTLKIAPLLEELILLIMNFVAFKKSFIHFDIYYKKFEPLIMNDGFEYKRGKNKRKPQEMNDMIGYYTWYCRYGNHPFKATYPIPLIMVSSIGCCYGVHKFIFKLIDFSCDTCIGFIQSSNINLYSQNISNVELKKCTENKAKINIDISGYFWRSKGEQAVIKKKILLNDEWNENTKNRIDKWGNKKFMKTKKNDILTIIH